MIFAWPGQVPFLSERLEASAIEMVELIGRLKWKDDYLLIGTSSPEIKGFSKREETGVVESKVVVEDESVDSVVLAVDSMDFIDGKTLRITSSEDKEGLSHPGNPVSSSSVQLIPQKGFLSPRLCEISQHFKYHDSGPSIINYHHRPPTPLPLHNIPHMIQFPKNHPENSISISWFFYNQKTQQ